MIIFLFHWNLLNASELMSMNKYLAKDERNFSWASRAARASSSSKRLQLYHDEPCGSHDPKHTQQKSCLQFWFLQTWFYLNENKINSFKFKILCYVIFLSIYHMITTAILFNCNITFWTFLCISCYPIRCFWIIVTLFNPFF